MGYNIDSFFDLFDDLPKFPLGFAGNDVFLHFMKKEGERLPVEAFVGLKIESLLTKICTRQENYIKLYYEYKNIAKIAQDLYNSNTFT